MSGRKERREKERKKKEERKRDVKDLLNDMDVCSISILKLFNIFILCIDSNKEKWLTINTV